MKQVSAREANQQFAAVLSSVEHGEQIVITKRGRPVAVMSPYAAEMDQDKKAALAEMRTLLRRPLVKAADLRSVSRDEMHERP